MPAPLARPTSEGPYPWQRIHGAVTTQQVTSGPGKLHSIVVGTAGTTIVVLDGTNVITTIGAVTGTFIFDCEIVYGVVITTTGTPDLAVMAV